MSRDGRQVASGQKGGARPERPRIPMKDHLEVIKQIHVGKRGLCGRRGQHTVVCSASRHIFFIAVVEYYSSLASTHISAKGCNVVAPKYALMGLRGFKGSSGRCSLFLDKCGKIDYSGLINSRDRKDCNSNRASDQVRIRQSQVVTECRAVGYVMPPDT